MKNVFRKMRIMPRSEMAYFYMKIIITLSYKGKIYHIHDEWHEWTDENFPPYIWMEGNYACDCNRSDFINNQCDPNFELINCGEEIKLITINKDK
jgi:hypothetical protein